MTRISDATQERMRQAWERSIPAPYRLTPNRGLRQQQASEIVLPPPPAKMIRDFLQAIRRAEDADDRAPFTASGKPVKPDAPKKPRTLAYENPETRKKRLARMSVNRRKIKGLA